MEMKKNADYSKTVMYKIVCNDLSIKDCYVGSTTGFARRENVHKYDCTNAKSKNYNSKVYKFIRDHGNWDNWSIILIENYPCKDHSESLLRERYWAENLNATLNSQVQSRTHKQYNKENVQIIF